jgi:hypothetical protein
LRKEKGRAAYIEYMWEATAVVASKGLWEYPDITLLEQFTKPNSLEEHFREERLIFSGVCAIRNQMRSLQLMEIRKRK